MRLLLAAVASLCAVLAFSAAPEQEPAERVVRPRESDEVLVNPGMGFTTFQVFEGSGARTDLKWSEGFTGTAESRKPGYYPQTSVAYVRTYWRDLEPEQGKPRWELIDHALARAAKQGQTLMVRLMPYGDRKESEADVPDWYRKLTGETPDQKQKEEAWRVDQSREEYARHFGALIEKFAKRYDGNPTLESVDVSFSGPWGEGSGTALMPESSRKRLKDAYFDGFKKTFLTIQPWDGKPKSPPVGLRFDCLGDMNGFSPTWSHMLDLYPQEIIRSGMRDAWTERPVTLEACWVMGEWKKRGFDLDYIIEQSLKWHISSFNAKSSAVPPGWRSKVDQWLKKMGYRLVLRRFSFPTRVEPGGELRFTSWWENKGVAPPYRDYRLALRLRGKNETRVLYPEGPISIRGWLPGDQLGDGSVRLPKELGGEFELQLGIVDPSGGDPQPKIRLAIAGRRDDGWYPLGKLKIAPAPAAALSGWPAERLRGSNVFHNTPPEDLRHLAKNWGANTARVLEVDLLSMKPPHPLDEARLAKTFAVIDEGMRQGLYMIIGLGTAMGDHDLFFRSPEFRKAYLELWRKVATRYHEHGATLAYDLMNEPHDGRADREWSKYARDLTAAIREIDTRHTIIVEPPGWGWPHGFPNLTPTGDSNTVYSFHFYGPMDLTHLRGYDSSGKFIGHLKATEAQWKEREYPGWITDGLHATGKNPKVLWNQERMKKALEPAIAFRDRYKVPLWCGEFGAARWARGASRWFKDWVGLLEDFGIGWASYAFRENEWDAMDIEMDPEVRDRPTPRTETELVSWIKKVFSRGR